MEQRAQDSYKRFIYEFIDHVLVICPQCESRASVHGTDYSFTNDNEEKIKVVCVDCGYNKLYSERKGRPLYFPGENVVEGKHIIIGNAIDPFFHLPLWYTVRFEDDILWAYNLEHIDFLYCFISGKLRERNGQAYFNSSLGSRLPKWMTSSKNRSDVLKLLDRLRNKQ